MRLISLYLIPFQDVFSGGGTITETSCLLVCNVAASLYFSYQYVNYSAMPAMPGSKVFTNSPLVHEARYVACGLASTQLVLTIFVFTGRE